MLALWTHVSYGAENASIEKVHQKMAAHDQSDFDGLRAHADDLRALEDEMAGLEEQWLELSELVE